MLCRRNIFAIFPVIKTFCPQCLGWMNKTYITCSTFIIKNGKIDHKLPRWLYYCRHLEKHDIMIICWVYLMIKRTFLRGQNSNDKRIGPIILQEKDFGFWNKPIKLNLIIFLCYIICFSKNLWNDRRDAVSYLEFIYQSFLNFLSKVSSNMSFKSRSH